MDYVRTDIRNLAELVRHALTAPDGARYQFLSDAPDGTGKQVAARDLAQRAYAYCGWLQQHGLQPGDRVLILAPALELALPCLLGASLCGAVPASILPPLTAADLASYAARVASAARASEARLVVGPAKLLQLLPELALPCLALETARDAAHGEPVASDPWDDAWLVLDGEAGAELTARTFRHADVLASLEAACAVADLSHSDVFVSWLPLSHDAGLLAALLPLYARCSAALLSTTQFLRRPGSWLRAISRVRGSVSCAPGRAYALCAQRVADDELAGLDLSSWRRALSVDELPPPQAAEAFQQRFAAAGLSGSALCRTQLFRALQRDLEAPLSLGQQALWFLAQLAPDSVAYNESLCLRIRSPYDARALCAALETLLVRHPSLRTVFGARGGLPYRKLLERVPAALQVIDAAAWSEAELSERLLQEAEQRFDLEHGPVFVMRLYTRGPSDALLLFAAHHSVVDGFSQVRIVAELAELYPRAVQGASLALPAPSQSYDDFVRWQARLLAGAEGARLRSFWQRELQDAPLALSLPLDRPRPALQTYAGATIPVELPGALVDALRTLGKRHDATLYAVLLAVFQGLLHRLSGQRDILVATPGLGRSGMAFADVVGFFVNTLPIRARIDADTSFETLLGRARASTLEALDHQDLPFASIVELLRVPRDPSRAPLCQVLFQLHTYRPSDDVLDVLQGWAAGKSAQLGGMTVEAYELERRIAQFELALDLTDFGAGVSGRLEYNTDLFDEATVRAWIEQFLALAEHVVRAPDAPLASPTAEVLPPEQRELVLQRWNATAVDYPDGRVHRAIEAQAARDPERIAVSAGDLTLSYGELERRASRIARQLRAAGAGRDALIGVCMDRSLDLITVLLGVMKAGAAYLPLDPTYPAARVRFMIDDAQPAVIIADAPYLTLVQPSSAPVWSTRSVLERGRQEAEAWTDDVAPEDLAYVIYTSGSTGTPKGVANTHAGLWNRLQWMQEYLQLGSDDRVLHKTPYSFDVSVWELFWPLLTGARLVIAAPNGHTDSRYLADEIARRGVTTVHFVPSMLEAFLLEPELDRCACLSRVVCSGEALPYGTMTRCLELLPNTGLHNLYGPTEASIDVSYWRCVPNARGVVPIGRPIANTQLYILDAQLQPVAIGSAGELYIGGIGLARGYHARPELTAERFIQSPFSPGARLYRTGDLARYDADGCIEYLGRNDDQIKLRGFRIELGEIEAALREHPELQAAAVVSDGTRLEAFVVCKRADLDASALRGWLKNELPEHMVPTRIVPIERLPLTHSGKTDRRALLHLSAEPRARSCVAPRTPLERELVEIFREVLRVPELSIHDNYFELGGDSIRSLQVRALARARGLMLEVAWLLTHQTIAELAARIGHDAQPSRDESPAPFALLRQSERATLDDFDDAYPATRLQLGMLYHSALTRDSWAYHDVMSLRIELGTAWQEAAMAGALDAVIARHPVLRASFDAGTYAQPIQRIHRTVPRPLAVCDLRGLDAEAAREAIRSYIEQDKRRGYDLAAAPLFRLMIHVLDARTVQLTLGFHHAILDGWSTATLLRELFTEYLSRSGAEGLPVFDAPPHAFSAFVALEQQALGSEVSRNYFASALEEMQLTRLPR
ncbi:MAG TPA: amino acid adenylation domain-containing protein, partial [Polyangiales bacterium]|nr:amino acid adenylation domain-containing protein [Polyangiales bacterium]